MKNKNFWSIVLAFIGLGLILIGVIEPNAEALGIKPEWLGTASMILLSLKLFLQQSGLIPQDKADQQSAMFATDMNRNKALARRMDPDDGFSTTDVKVWRQRNI